ncbi:MAG: glycosyl hydrolase 2 galactose-binding domain-containing protein [bacterium]
MHLRTAWTVLLVALCAAAANAAAPFVWVEAEDTAETNFKHFEVSSMGKPQLLSGGQWIMKGMGPDEVKKLVPEEGVRLRYKADVPQAGSYTLWVRIGWYGARANCRVRVGEGPWRELPKTLPTINLMELGFFCEASWANLGTVDLQAGETTVEVHFPKTKGEKERMLCALDCFALIQGKFTPEGAFKPGETYDGPDDRRAASQVFELPPPEGVERTAVKLDGLWQVARYDDPDMDEDAYVPVQELPAPDEVRLRWMGFEVPGNPWQSPPLVFGHRLIYRTRVRVPAEHRGRGFKLHFSGTHWIVSVFVNGRLAGTHRGVWVPWDLDVSRFIEPGQVNELAVAVKGTYYAFDAKAMGGGTTLNKLRNRPLSRKRWTRWVAPIYPSAKGDGDGYIYGIVNPVTLVSVGDAYTEDVFIKPSVAKKRLEAEVAVRNTAARPRRLAVRCEGVCERSGEAEKAFGPVQVEVPARGTATAVVAGAWADPKLWWPEPNPHLYRLRTTVSEGGKTVDVQEETFGFREVTIEGTGICINGVRRNFWNWVDVHQRFIEQPEQWARCWREEGNRFMRFSHGRRIRRALPSREERLAFYDRAGIPGRLCTMIDGMFISYNLGQRTGDKGPDGKPILVPNEPVWDGFRRHMAQVAKAYRNHPSVIFYQVENELVYINGMNIYGAYLDKVEELMNEVVEAGREHDPTRPYTVGGGGDLSGRLEINCPHYPHTALDYYPENAYTVEHFSTKIQRWPWKRQKPWVVGESLFANELRLGAYAAGDEVYRGKQAALRGKARFLRMVYGGYRWAGVAGFFPWDNLWQFDDTRKIFSDLYACPRKQTARLFAGKENRLRFKILNDTLSSEPVTLEWQYGGSWVENPGEKAGPQNPAKTFAIEGEATFQIEPGFGEEHEIVIQAPQVPRRVDATLALTLRQKGAEDTTDKRLVPVLPAVHSLECEAPAYVLDRQGALARFLAGAELEFQKIDGLDALAGKTGLLLVGHDTLTPAEAYGTGLLAFAAGGGRVICLEQENPVGGANLPAPVRTTQRFGGYAHPQALGTPVFEDLGKDDLIDWASDHPTYKRAYHKPSQGGRSLAECGGELQYSPLIEVPCGQGVIVLCQLRVAEKLGLEPAADILLRNLVRVYADYRPTSGVVAVTCPDDPLLAEKVQATGVLAREVSALAEALDPDRFAVALVHASEANLEALLGLGERVAAFQRAGGWLMLNGLGPKGIEELNRLVGADHMLRPFRIERVTLESPHHPLAATLGNRDVALYSPKELMHGRYWVSGNTFSYVIDGQNFAPFTLPPGAKDDPFHYQPTFDDHDPYNWVNGMLNEESWRYIRQIWVDREAERGPVGLVHTFRLRRPDVVKQITIWNNANYSTIEKLDIVFDGEEASAVTAELPDAAQPETVVLPEPRKVAKTITLRIRSWRVRPHSHPKAANLVGIDNVEFLRPRPPAGCVFLDSAGGLVAFPRGEGGVFLNQLNFMAEEPRESNAAQKVRVLGVLLQNMGAGFRTASQVAVPGRNVRYTPHTLQEHCTAYLSAVGGKAGWFGRKGADLSALPRGRQVLADVTYHVVDYGTAPIPDCIILGGRGAPGAVRKLPESVEGIPVEARADLLFFLHTAEVTRPVTDRERARMHDRRRPFVLPTVMKYVLHYADGKTAEVPVVLEKHVDHWVREEALPLVGAQVAWAKPLEALDGQRAVLYSMQAENPRPGVPIESIDVVKTGRRAAPAVLAITTGVVAGK